METGVAGYVCLSPESASHSYLWGEERAALTPVFPPAYNQPTHFSPTSPWWPPRKGGGRQVCPQPWEQCPCTG